MKIYYIRHAKTEANQSNKWQGLSDIDLSQSGLEELNNLKKEVENINFDIVISSPLKRAIKTAQIFKNKEEILIDNLIIERDFGSLEQQKVDESDKDLLSDFELNTDLNAGVEKIQNMYYNRIKPFLLNIKKKYQHSNNKILIVSHSWVGRLIVYFCSQEKDKNSIKIAPKNAKIYEFEI